MEKSAQGGGADIHRPIGAEGVLSLVVSDIDIVSRVSISRIYISNAFCPLSYPPAISALSMPIFYTTTARKVNVGDRIDLVFFA